MAFAVTNIGTNNNAAGATVAVTVGAGGVPSGCIIVVQVAESANSAPAGSVADSASNTYVAEVGANHSGATAQGFGRVFDVVGAAALVNTNTITYTKAVSGSAASISACYVTGAATTSPLDTAVTASATGNSTTPSVTSGTPTIAGELFIGFSSENNVRVYTQASGWASPPTLVNAAIPFTLGGNRVNAGAGTLTYNPTLAISANWMAAVIAYKPFDTLQSQICM
jgi:hypothetical protein